MAETVDPRVARTRRLLAEAIFALIQEKRWQQIRVQDILDRSGISRSAFYAHYANQYDLLTAVIPQFTLPVARSRPGSAAPDLWPLFEHVEHMADVLRPLMTQPVLADIVRTFEDNLAAAWRERLGTGPRAEVAARFLAGAIAAVIRDRVTARVRPPAREACRATTRLVETVLADLGDPPPGGPGRG